MEKYIATLTNVKNVYHIVTFSLFGLKENGYYTFNLSSGFYLKTKNSRSDTSLIIDGSYLSDYYDDYDKIETKPTEVNPVLEKYNHCDLMGAISHPIYNLIYFVQTKSDSYFNVMEKCGFPMEKIKADYDHISKYNNYHLTQYLIDLHKKRNTDLDQFQQEITRIFGYEIPKYKTSPSFVGAISSMLNLEHNAIPFKFISEAERERVSLDVYLDLFKENPNSSYDYKLKNRKPNPVF